MNTGMKADHIHTPHDGRAPRDVFLDGKPVEGVFFADTRRGIVCAFKQPLRLDKRRKRLLFKTLHGTVEVLEKAGAGRGLIAHGPARCGCWASEVTMGTMSEVETPTAAKQHRCCWCWQMIEAGEQYRRYRYWEAGDAGTVKPHAECFDAMQDAAEDQGGWIEWTPGSGEKPNV